MQVFASTQNRRRKRTGRTFTRCQLTEKAEQPPEGDAAYADVDRRKDRNAT